MALYQKKSIEAVIEQLVALYEQPFGGKGRGRFRISMKIMCRLFGQRRIWPDQIEAIYRGLFERGYLFVDLETYFIVVSQQTFSSYRRVNDASIMATSHVGRNSPVEDSDDSLVRADG